MPDFFLFMLHPLLGSLTIEPPSDETVALAKTVGGSGLAGFLFKYLLDRVKGADAKIDAAHTKAELKRDATLELISEKCSKMEFRLNSIDQRLDMYSGVVKEVKDRVEGVSANHGPRIGDQEQSSAVLDSRVDALEADNREIRSQLLRLTAQVAATH